MKTSKVKAYFEYFPETVDHEEEIHLDLKENDPHKCLLAHEIENVGVLKEWFDGLDLKKYLPGDYEVEYQHDTDWDGCDGFKYYEYEVVVGVVEMIPLKTSCL